MRSPVVVLIAALAALIACLYVVHRPEPVLTSELGNVWRFPAWTFWSMRNQPGFIYLFSGAHGWTDEDAAIAAGYARRGNEVIGIDVREYLRHLDTAGSGCIFLPGPLEQFSRARQRAAGSSGYSEPVLLGNAEGATLAYLAMRQAPPLAFAAAVGVDAAPTLSLHRDFCDVPAPARNGNGQTLSAITLPAPPSLAMVSTAQATTASRQFVAAISASGNPKSQPGTAAQPLADIYRSALEGLQREHTGNSVADLPLVENPATGDGGDTFAILYSGDGGWRDLDRSLATILANKGLPVVGVDVLSYFWGKRMPEAAAADLGRIIEHYQQQWHRRKVVLIGFSFGGNVLPFMINRMPDSIRRNIVLTALLSPERTAAFEIATSAWFGFDGGSDRPPIAPELSKIADGKVQCYYGEDEADSSACTDGLPQRIEVIRKRGGHHFDRDYGELADELLMSLPKGDAPR